MTDIFFDGATYISAAKAAASKGVARDYIARLCKEGKLEGRRVGTHWYVNKDSFQTFVLDKEYSQAKQREKLVSERKREYGTRKGSHSRRFLVSAPTSAFDMRVSIPLHALAPGMHFFHKLVALFIVAMCAIGTYAFVDAQLERIAARPAPLSSPMLASERTQLAAAAESSAGAFGDTLAGLEHSINATVDSLLQAVIFIDSLIYGNDTSGIENLPTVSARVSPGHPPF